MVYSTNIRQEIADKLETAFAAVDEHYTPLIYCVTLPSSEEGNDELEKEAKGKADNGLVYVGCGPMSFKDEAGGIYTHIQLFNILIFQNDKSSDTLVHNLFDIALDCLHTQYKLYSAQPPLDVKGYKSGLMMAWIQVFKEPEIYGNR